LHFCGHYETYKLLKIRESIERKHSWVYPSQFQFAGQYVLTTGLKNQVSNVLVSFVDIENAFAHLQMSTTELGTIHLRCRQIFTIFDPYPPLPSAVSLLANF
jgi:hypothetical protein